MKLISFLVFLAALIGNSKASAIATTIHVLQSIEQNTEETSQVSEQEITLDSKREVDISLNVESRIPGIGNGLFHCNFSLDRLTIYYTSRLKA